MKYDLWKINDACLKLMRWRWSTRWKMWLNPERCERIDAVEMVGASEFTEDEICRPIKAGCLPDDIVPRPAFSLDDALPLMEKFLIELARSFKLIDGGWEAAAYDANSKVIEVIDASAPLAVCLCALKCAGHDLASFETASGGDGEGKWNP